jgi:hypothetical protein
MSGAEGCIDAVSFSHVLSAFWYAGRQAGKQAGRQASKQAGKAGRQAGRQGLCRTSGLGTLAAAVGLRVLYCTRSLVTNVDCMHGWFVLVG